MHSCLYAILYTGRFLFIYLDDEALSKEGLLWEEPFLLTVDPIQKGGKDENRRIASSESESQMRTRGQARCVCTKWNRKGYKTMTLTSL